MQYKKNCEIQNELIPTNLEYEKSLHDSSSDILGYQQLGFDIGTDALSELIQILLKEHRIDEVDRVTKDKEYRTKMLKEYNLI